MQVEKIRDITAELKMFNSDRVVLDKLYEAIGDTEPGFVFSFIMISTSFDYDGVLLRAVLSLLLNNVWSCGNLHTNFHISQVVVDIQGHALIGLAS